MDEKGRILMLKLDLVQPNKEQPRKTLMKRRLMSWRNPLKIMECCSHYWCRKTIAFMRIIAGERRWRAAKAGLGLKEVSGCLKEYSKQEANGNLSY